MKPRPLSTPLPTLALTLALLWPAAAGAQDIWRCGAEGRSYSATPCAEGRRVEVPAARPAADVAAARDVAHREAALADAQQRERARIEARQRGSGLGAIAATQPPVKAPKAWLERKAAKQPAKRPRPAEAGTWRAVAPASRRTPG